MLIFFHLIFFDFLYIFFTYFLYIIYLAFSPSGHRSFKFLLSSFCIYFFHLPWGNLFVLSHSWTHFVINHLHFVSIHSPQDLSHSVFVILWWILLLHFFFRTSVTMLYSSTSFTRIYFWQFLFSSKNSILLVYPCNIVL